LGLHPAPEFFVDPLDHVRRADGLPLRRVRTWDAKDAVDARAKLTARLESGGLR
jgi:hypothetical protein